MAGPGEGHPLQSTILHFEGVIRVEGTLLRWILSTSHSHLLSRFFFVSVSPRRFYLLFSTKNPSTIQRVPWPSDKENDSVESRRRPLGYDTWLLNSEDFSWFIDPDGGFWITLDMSFALTRGKVSVNKIVFSRISSGEIWVTSDGRAYFVHLREDIDNEISSDEVLFPGEVYHRARSFSCNPAVSSHRVVGWCEQGKSTWVSQSAILARALHSRLWNPKMGAKTAANWSWRTKTWKGAILRRAAARKGDRYQCKILFDRNWNARVCLGIYFHTISKPEIEVR